MISTLETEIKTEDTKLIQQYLEGDEKSLEVLIAKYIGPIYSFIYKNVGDRAVAEDITQEVFIKIWKNLKKFDLSKNFSPWLFQIARNTSIDYLRKKKSIPFSRFENDKEQNALSENLAQKPANILENLSDKKVLESAMKNLNEKEGKIINLRHNIGMSFKEIADIFNESINTIKSRYRRALINLRKNIKK
jgi:RNA polymerase sigma factor (sigma-70 family)